MINPEKRILEGIKNKWNFVPQNVIKLNRIVIRKIQYQRNKKEKELRAAAQQIPFDCTWRNCQSYEQYTGHIPRKCLGEWCLQIGGIELIPCMLGLKMLWTACKKY